MTTSRPIFAALLALAGWIAVPATGHAAQSYDNCIGFIDSLPATLTTQGTWCLRKDLSTGITSGTAITIATNNVTIDCNDFKLGGLPAGDGTLTIGINSQNRLNATVRRCNIRGFLYGLKLEGTGGGHVVEDNRFESNTLIGLQVEGYGSVIRRNLLIDTGGSTVSKGYAIGIITSSAVDVLDNSVTGVLPTASAGGIGYAYGIYSESNTNGRIRGNAVRGLVGVGNQTIWGIQNNGTTRVSVTANDVIGPGYVGISCFNNRGSARDNSVNGFDIAISACTDSGGNAVLP